MKYNEKVFYIRKNLLHMSQSEFAELLGMKQGSISNVETGNGDRRLGREKEAALIQVASLPIGFFENFAEVDPQSTLNNPDALFWTLVPEAKTANVTLSQVRHMLKALTNGKFNK